MRWHTFRSHLAQGFAQVCPFCAACVRKTLAVFMSNGERDFDIGSARRKRERRLRCFLRHEEIAVRMALARATHHAVQRHQCTQTVTLAATFAATPAPLPVIEYMVSAPTVNHVAPAPVIEYVSSAPGIEYIAPAPAVTPSVPSQQLPPAYTTTVEYGFCYPVNRSFTMCHPLILEASGPL